MSVYRFTLTDDDGSVVFGTEKVANWQDIELSLVRSDEYRNRIRRISSVFSFVKEIRTRLFRSGDRFGTNAMVRLLIEVGNDNFEEDSFNAIGNGVALFADFKTLKRTELTADISFIDSSFQELIFDNQKKKLNFNTDTSLVGTEMSDFQIKLRDVILHDRVFELNSLLVPTDDHNPGGDRITLAAIPFNVSYASDDNVKNVPWNFITNSLNPKDLLADSYFYLKSDVDKVLNIDMKLNLGISTEWGRYLSIELMKVDDNYDPITNEVLWSVERTSDFQEAYLIEVDYVESIDIKRNESLQLFLRVTGDSSLETTNLYLFGNMSTITFNSKSYATVGQTTSKCILPHEYIDHMIEIMTGESGKFYSKFFGRTDIGYEEDGEGAYLSIQDGHMIRNLPFEENPLNSKFIDVLNDLMRIYNLVAGISYEGDTEVFRIDTYDDIYGSNEVFIDLGDLVSEIEFSISNEKEYGSIEVGYTDLQPENLNGLESMFGELNYSTPILSENTLDLKIKGIADDYAIEQTRRKQYSNSANEDTKYDKKIFYITARKDVSGNIIAKRSEDYEIVEGVLDPSTVYNLDISPRRIFDRWQRVVKSFLLKNTSDQLTLTKSAKNNSVITQKYTEDNPVVEGSDIEISDLLDPYVKTNDISIGDAPMDLDTYSQFEENPNKIIKFTNKDIDFYMVADICTYSPSNQTVSINGMEANR